MIGVDVTQELSIIENSATGRDDVVKIKYIVKNDTEYCQTSGHKNYDGHYARW